MDKITITRIKTETNRKLRLEGVEALQLVEETIDSEITVQKAPAKNGKTSTKEIYRNIVDKKTEVLKSLELSQVSAEELRRFRIRGIPSFVLKLDEKLYHCIIPKSLKFVGANLVGTHKCKDCRRLSGAPDEYGGCAKIRENSTCIEKYPWITKGFETFGVTPDSFVVGECLHFKSYSEKKSKFEEKKEEKVTLFDSIYPRLFLEF